MLLAVIMVFSVVSFELPDVFAGQATVNESASVSVTAPPAISVSSTEVTRVAAAANSLLPGTTIVKATLSGVPDLGTATYANTAYAGETPFWPSATITFPAGISPDATPGLTITASTTGGIVNVSSVTQTGQNYTASITGGTATAGNSIVYLISYYLNGIYYTSYAYSYVENVVMPAGIHYYYRPNDWFMGGTAGRMYVDYRYLGVNVYGNEAAGGTLGYYNFAANTFVEQSASPGKVQLKVYKDGGTDGQYNGGYGADANRPQASVYVDTSTTSSLSDLNLRISFFLYGDLGTYSTNNNLAGTYVQAGNVTSVSASDSTGAPATDAAATSQLGIVGTSATMQTLGDSIMATFTGTGPTATGATLYTVTMLTRAPEGADGNRTLSGFTSVCLTVNKYSKGALRTRINDILSGAAGKGINPQSWFYSSGWDTFKVAFDSANLILKKPNTSQSVIDSALTNLNSAYTALTPKVFAYSINSYINNTTNSIIPPVTSTGAYSGYVLIAVAETVPGYYLTDFESSPKQITLTETTKTVNFYYTARKYTLAFNSHGGSTVSSVFQDYNSGISKPSPDPTREHYTFTGWYTDEACTIPVTWPYAMPLNGGTLHAGWTLTPVTLTFYSDGTPVAPVTNIPGTSVDEPDAPTKEGWIFKGWYNDIAFQNPVSWPVILTYSNIMIYAHFVYVDYTINFDSNDGTTVEPMTVTPETSVWPPADPARQGYTFDGWFYDNGTFIDPVHWPIVMGENGFTLYAKWSPTPVTIHFNTDGGNVVSDINDYVGNAVTAPAPPRKFGFIFAGWTLNGAPYQFTVMPTANITLLATWTATVRAAQTKLETFKTVGGSLVPTTSARAGDIVTVVLSTKTNFYCGSTRFVIVYDKNFYTVVGSAKAAITPNPANPYYSGIIGSYAGTTVVPDSMWPATFSAAEKAANMFVTASFNTGTGTRPLLLSDSSSLFSIQLQVKADAAGSGRIFMDKRFDRSSTNTGGFNYYFYCTGSGVLCSTGISTLDFDTDYVDADRTVTLDTSAPVMTHIYFNSNGGSSITPLYGEVGTTAAIPANPVWAGHTFVKWTPDFPGAFQPTDTYLEASWTLNTHTTTFISHDSITYTTVPNVAYGSTINSPGTPVWAGHTFRGWSPILPATMGDADMTFYGTWDLDYHNAIFKLDTGAPWGTPTAVQYGSAIPLPAEPSKEGYRFTGWNPNPIGMTMGTADITFTAQFSKNTYFASFYAHNALVPNGTVPTAYGDQIIAPPDPQPNVGEAFDGWSPTPGIMGSANVDFIAKFKPIIYNVYFYNGATLLYTVPTVVGQSVTLPEQPNWLGHTFLSWLGLPLAMPEQEVTVYADWSTDQYWATFMNGSETWERKLVYYGDPVEIPAVSPSKEGNDFTAWSNYMTTMPANDLTMTALFTPTIYHLRYWVNGEVWQDIPTPYGAEITVLGAPPLVGQTFTGWGDYPGSMPAGDVDLYAGLTTNQHAVEFYVGEELYVTYPSVDFGSAIDLPDGKYIPGYTFAEWLDVPDTMPDNDIQIYASYVKNQHNATFMANGEVWQVIPVYFGDPVDRPETVPSKEGYSFNGWLSVPDAMPDDNITVYADWAINHYDVTFYYDENQVYGPPISVAFGDSIPLPVSPVKADWFFGGWSPAVPDKMPAAPQGLVFTATWTHSAYNAIFMVDNVEYDRVLTGVGAPVVLSKPNPEKAGAVFLGWEQAGGIEGLPAQMPSMEMTFYAKWFSLNEITVEFNLNGGTGTVPVSQAGVEGSDVFLPPVGDIARANYTFMGWSTDPLEITPLVSYLIPSADTTLYAVWNITKMGDVNADGKITSLDARMALRSVSSGGIPLTAVQKQAGDINGDNKISSVDARAILRLASTDS